jgi:hypothetical protein
VEARSLKGQLVSILLHLDARKYRIQGYTDTRLHGYHIYCQFLKRRMHLDTRIHGYIGIFYHLSPSKREIFDFCIFFYSNFRITITNYLTSKSVLLYATVEQFLFIWEKQSSAKWIQYRYDFAFESTEVLNNASTILQHQMNGKQ